MKYRAPVPFSHTADEEASWFCLQVGPDGVSSSWFCSVAPGTTHMLWSSLLNVSLGT